MIRYLSVAAILAVGATVAYAQNADVIKQRRELMRTVASFTAPVVPIAKGEQVFDLAKVQAALKAIHEHAPKLKALFPDDSKAGGGTDALAKVWSDRAGFNAAIDNWSANAKRTAELVKDEASFKENYPKFGGGCNGCHKSADGYAITLSESFKKPRP